MAPIKSAASEVHEGCNCAGQAVGGNHIGSAITGDVGDGNGTTDRAAGARSRGERDGWLIVDSGIEKHLRGADQVGQAVRIDVGDDAVSHRAVIVLNEIRAKESRMGGRARSVTGD